MKKAGTVKSLKALLKSSLALGLIFTATLAIETEAAPIRRGEVEARLTQIEDEVSSLKNQSTNLDTEKVMRRIQKINQDIKDMDDRLARIESYLDSGGGSLRPPGRDPVPSTFVCSLKDTFQGKVYVEKASSQMMAEFNVKESCQSKVHPSYCRAAVECDSTARGVRGYACLLEDTFQGRSYVAEGVTLVEAKANVVNSCQSKVHPSYCVRKEPKCEEL